MRERSNGIFISFFLFCCKGGGGGGGGGEEGETVFRFLIARASARAKTYYHAYKLWVSCTGLWHPKYARD